MSRFIRDRLRRKGFYDAGQLQNVVRGAASINTQGRPYARDGVPLTPSDESSEGNDNLFLVGPDHSLPSTAGQWAYIV